MDSKITKFLKTFDISDNEINDIINLSPMLKETSYQEFMDNCNLLIKYGYPKSDLDVLILSNPNIFVRSKQDLEKDLITLLEQYKSIEQILKLNPYII